MSFPINIRYLRKKAGWTQTEASKKLDVKMHNLSAYEEGRATPPLATIKKFITTYEIQENDVYILLFGRLDKKIG